MRSRQWQAALESSTEIRGQRPDLSIELVTGHRISSTEKHRLLWLGSEYLQGSQVVVDLA